MIKRMAFIIALSACCITSADDEFVMTRQNNKYYDSFLMCDVFSASYIVKQEVTSKRIILFATQLNVKSRVEKINGFFFKIIIDPETLRSHGLNPQTGGYTRFHNLFLMDYAINQYLYGDKTIGIYLIRTLAQISPDGLLKVSNDFYTFSQIVDKINRHEKSVLQLLEYRNKQWQNINGGGELDVDAYCFYENYNSLVGSFASCYIFRQEVEEKNILIFATAHTTAEFKAMKGYAVTVVASSQIIRNNISGLGSYNQQHDLYAFRYAASQYIYGNKEYGYSLLKILSEIAPSIKINVSDTTIMSFPEIMNNLPLNEKLIKSLADSWQEMLTIEEK